MAELEKCLTDDDKVFHPDSQHITHVIIDFMSSTRHNQAYTKFGDMVNAAHLSSTEFKTTMTLIAYDSYVELSLKEGERLRRACEDTIDVIEIKEDTPFQNKCHRSGLYQVTKSSCNCCRARLPSEIYLTLSSAVWWLMMSFYLRK